MACADGTSPAALRICMMCYFQNDEELPTSLGLHTVEIYAHGVQGLRMVAFVQLLHAVRIYAHGAQRYFDF